MVLLGLGVRKGATPLDGWFQRGYDGPLSRLLVLTDAGTAQAILVAALAAALVRRLWALVPMMVAIPLLAVLATDTLKPWFGRLKEDALAYPSGHTTVLVVVLGLFVLAVGVRWWIIVAAAVFAALGIVGQSVTYHYFTDTVGSVLLGTSLVCLVAASLRWSRRR